MRRNETDNKTQSGVKEEILLQLAGGAGGSRREEKRGRREPRFRFYL